MAAGSPTVAPPRRVRFGPFEADFETGELRKAGRRLRLQDQPLKILANLCARPGQLVSRDELRERLWPADTFVDFEHGLNTAVKRLRDALGDNPDRPTYIETLPRRGYRLIAQLETVADSLPEPVEPASPLQAEPRADAVRPGRFPVRGTLVTLAASATLVTAWALSAWPRPRGPAAVKHLEIELPDVLNETAQPFTLSHDGTKLVFATGSFQDARLFIRSLDGLGATRLVRTVSARAPVFSPDDQWVAFGVDDDTTLRKVPAAGGPAVVLARTRGTLLGGLDWSESGIYYSAGGLSGEGLSRVAETGGTPEPVTIPDAERGETAHVFPQVLPGDRDVMFTVLSAKGREKSQVVVQSLTTGARRVLLQGVSRARYVSSGHLVYGQGDVLLAAPFDLSRLAITGTPVEVVDGVASAVSTGIARFAVAEEGTLVYAPDIRVDQQTLVWVDRVGRETPLGSPPRAYAFPVISPDGRRVAVLVGDDRNPRQRDVCLYDPASRGFDRLTFDGSVTNAIWERGGEALTYAVRRQATFTMMRQATVGDRRAESLFSRGLGLWPGSWMPDGRALSYMEMSSAGTGGDLLVFEPGAAQPHRPFLSTTTTEWGARLSPDGRWMAYISNQSGRWEAYLRPFPGPGSPVQVSIEGGTEVVWAPSGGELFYRHADGVFAAPVRTGPNLAVGKPERLFGGPYATVLPGVANYDVSRDANRLLMVKPGPEESAPRALRFVLNWPGRLTRGAVMK